jgi:hypothetical protein
MHGTCHRVHGITHASVRVNGQYRIEFSALTVIQLRRTPHDRDNARRELVVSARVQFDDHTRPDTRVSTHVLVSDEHWTCQSQFCALGSWYDRRS